MTYKNDVIGKFTLSKRIQVTMKAIMYTSYNNTVAMTTYDGYNFYWGSVTIIVSNFGSLEGGAACTGKPACLSETCFFNVAKLGDEKSQ